MNHFVTISTAGHLYKVYALAESLQQQRSDFLLHVLVTDANDSYNFANCKFYSLKDIEQSPTAASIIAKYKGNSDKLRWCNKPIMMQYLLNQGIADKVIYLDNDLFFYADYSFLFDLLDEHSIILTPHYYKANPNDEQNWLEANFKVGLYNAGFVGANKKGLDSLQWWAECCLYRCEKSPLRGLFDDQKYLDLIPVHDSLAHVVRHLGCNIAGWNQEYCKRETAGNQVLINGKYPIVFIHYNYYTFQEILEGRDTLLIPYYKTYFDTLKKYKPGLTENQLYAKPGIVSDVKLLIWKVFTRLGW
jgi:lipopolysaccharide biosynthesis glycosyltransferase